MSSPYRLLNTPEIVPAHVATKIVDSKSYDPAVMEFAAAGFSAMFAEIDRLASSPASAPAMAH